MNRTHQEEVTEATVRLVTAHQIVTKAVEKTEELWQQYDAAREESYAAQQELQDAKVDYVEATLRAAGLEP
jgi:hypothetical protein